MNVTASARRASVSAPAHRRRRAARSAPRRATLASAGRRRAPAERTRGVARAAGPPAPPSGRRARRAAGGTRRGPRANRPHAVEPRAAMIERRIGLLFACFLLLLGTAIARAGWMQGIEGGMLSDDAQSQHTQTVAIPGQRGRILDRDGKELAVSEEAADVVATPYQVKDPAQVSRALARVLDLSKSKILGVLADRSAGFA